MSKKAPRNRLTVVLTVIAIIFVIASGLILLFKNGIFAAVSTTPQITSFNASQANGVNRETFELTTNFTLTSAYIWWDCTVQTGDDTLAELTSRCGVPYEQITTANAGTSFKGDQNKGARVKVYASQAGYKITLPQKTNAKAVLFTTGTNVPGLVKSATYSTNVNRAIAGTGGSNFSVKTANLIGHTSYTLEKLDDVDGSLPFRKYYLWYDCQAPNLTIATPVGTVAATCGTANGTFSVAGDRLIGTSTYLQAGSRRLVTIVQEKRCPTFSYTGDATCVYSSNSYVGALPYTITLKTPTPVPTVTSTSTKTPTPVPTVTSTSTSPVIKNFNFKTGFNIFGGTTPIPASKFAENSLRVYRFDGANNRWVVWPALPNVTSEAFGLSLGQGYYVHSTTDRTAALPFAALPTVTHNLTKGWNLLSNRGNKTLDTLKLTYGSQANKSAQELINNSTINPNIFIIENPQATAACNYFKLLTRTQTTPNCTSGTLGSTNTLLTDKAFWVYVP